MKKRAIMISMLLVMALSVTGCSQKTATKDKDTKTEETAKTDDAEETESDNTEDTSEDTPTTICLLLSIVSTVPCKLSDVVLYTEPTVPSSPIHLT